MHLGKSSLNHRPNLKTTPTSQVEKKSITSVFLPHWPMGNALSGCLRSRLCRNFILLISILILVGIAWSQTFQVPFLLDDFESISGNATIQDFASGNWMRPPSTGGETVSGRPVLNGSFALNQALLGNGVQGFHIGNLAIHMINTVLLFLVLSQLIKPQMTERTSSIHPTDFPPLSNGFTASDIIIWMITGCWALHPIQTIAVTYLSQRAESLAALFFLLAFWLSVTSEKLNRFRWVVSLTVCFITILGIGTKEWVAVFPIVLLIWARNSGKKSSWSVFKDRPLLYSGLLLCWIPAGFLIFQNRLRGGSVGTGSDVSLIDNFYTQAWAFVHYLRLLVFPWGFIFDYGSTFLHHVEEVIPQIIIVVAGIWITIWGYWRKNMVGFMGATFFLLLAPSSSLIPVLTQSIAEHRMYLPSVVVISIPFLLILRVYPSPLRKLSIWLSCGLFFMFSLTALTWNRNLIYQQELMLWKQTSERCPQNARAHNNYGLALMRSGQLELAQSEFEKTIALRPEHAFAYRNLGDIAMIQKDYARAAKQYQTAIDIDPSFTDAKINLGECRIENGESDSAIRLFEEVLEDSNVLPEVRTRLASLWLDKGQIEKAGLLLEKATRLNGKNPETWYQRGRMEELRQHTVAAVDAYTRVVKIEPSHFAANLALGRLLGKQGKTTQALQYLNRINTAKTATNPDLKMALGTALAKQQQFAEAEKCFHEVIQLNPDHLEAWNNLGNCQMMLHQFRNAKGSYEHALSIHADDPVASKNLEIVLEFLDQDETDSSFK